MSRIHFATGSHRLETHERIAAYLRSSPRRLSVSQIVQLLTARLNDRDTFKFNGSWFKLYNKIDKDGSGSITKEEFWKACRDELFVDEKKASDADLHDVWNAMDADFSGKVSVKEFGAFMRGRGDSAGVGFTNKSNALPSIKMGESATEAQASIEAPERLINKLVERDAKSGRFNNGNKVKKKGQVAPTATFDEGLVNFEGKEVHPVVQVMTTKLQADPVLGGSWFQLYNMIDTDKSGVVHYHEFLLGVREYLLITPSQVSDESVKNLWNRMDVDGSDTLKVGEFAAYLRGHSYEAIVGFSSKTAVLGAESMNKHQAEVMAAAGLGNERIIDRIVRREADGGRWDGRSDDAQTVNASESVQKERDHLRQMGESPSKTHILNGGKKGDYDYAVSKSQGSTGARNKKIAEAKAAAEKKAAEAAAAERARLKAIEELERKKREHEAMVARLEAEAAAEAQRLHDLEVARLQAQKEAAERAAREAREAEERHLAEVAAAEAAKAKAEADAAAAKEEAARAAEATDAAPAQAASEPASEPAPAPAAPAAADDSAAV